MYKNNLHSGKSLLKMLVGLIFYHGGAFGALRTLNNIFGKRLTIVTYHRVTEEKVEGMECSLPYLFVNVNTFEKQIAFFKKYYNITNFKDLCDFEKIKVLPRNSLIITFDDGYRDIFINAVPILRKHGVSCTIFLSTNRVGRFDVPWWDEVFVRLNFLKKEEIQNNRRKVAKDITNIYKEFKKNPSSLFLRLNNLEETKIRQIVEALRNCTNVPESLLIEKNRFLSWSEVNEIKDMVHFGSHGCSHVSLDLINIERINEEVSASKKEIENKCGEKVIAFSYPAGHHTKQVDHIVERSGYWYGVTQDRGVNNLEYKYALKRINIWEGIRNKSNGKFSEALFALRLSGI